MGDPSPVVAKGRCLDVGTKINTQTVGKRLAKYPGEWVVVDADNNRIVAHDVCFAAAVEATPRSTKKPNVYFAAPTDGAEKLLTI